MNDGKLVSDLIALTKEKKIVWKFVNDGVYLFATEYQNFIFKIRGYLTFCLEVDGNYRIHPENFHELLIAIYEEARRGEEEKREAASNRTQEKLENTFLNDVPKLNTLGKFLNTLGKFLNTLGKFLTYLKGK